MTHAINGNCDCYTAFEEGCRASTETFHIGESCGNPEHLLCAEEGGIPQDVAFTPELPTPDVWIGEYKIPGGELDRGFDNSHVYSTKYTKCDCGKGDWHVTQHTDGEGSPYYLCYTTERLREVLSHRPDAWFLRGERPS